MKKYKRKNIYVLLLILLCSLGIGYAFLRTELSINGTADFLDARWDIHFANLVVNPNSVELSTGNTAATISASTTEVTYAVTLKEPGDFYEFTVDAVNAGTIDGMIDTISSKMGGVEITNLPAYMEYSVTYSDGIALDVNQYLKAGELETYKVHVGFKKDISASDLTGQVESKTFSFNVTYVQADENAFVRAKTFADDDWDTILTNIQRNNSCGPYHLGNTREINIGSYGTHSLRIANCSTPPECYNEGFSQTACGIVLEFADIISFHEMNPSGEYNGKTYNYGWNVDGWPASSMREYVNNNIYNALPTEIKNAIVDTTVVSGHSDTSGETNFTSIDKLYLLSTHEVWEDVDGNPNDGIDRYDTAYFNTRQLDYYANLGVTLGVWIGRTYDGNYSGAVKKQITLNSSWWLRTPYSYDESFDTVRNDGIFANSVANQFRGVSPAFRIG